MIIEFEAIKTCSKSEKKNCMSLPKPKRVLEETNNVVLVWISFFLFWFILSVYYHYLRTNLKHFFNALKARFDLLVCIQKQPSRDVLRKKVF